MKVLITADVHIDDFPSYNYEKKSRLNQYITLANRIVELGKIHNCSEVWILGDLVNKPTSRGYVLHVAKQFLKILSNNFEYVRIILGNHDSDSKSQSLDFNTSQVTLLDYPNLVYMDKKIMEIDGHLIGWMNWYPTQDLEWLEDKHLDVLLGHYTKSDLFGQDIDDSKFDIMIHGDIHNRQEIGKFISVGNPIPIDFNSLCDDADVLIFDTESLKWSRVLVDPDHTRFLQMHYTENKAEEGFHGPLEYKVYKPRINFTDEESSQEKSVTWNDIDQLIRRLCEEDKILYVHDKVESNCVPYSEIDFNFQLKKFHIHGYRSIVDMIIDFNKGDRIVLLGDNGSGKSSIIRSMKGVFEKNSYLKNEQSDLCEDQLLELSLVYQNKLYEITKGNTCMLVIDGQEEQYSSKLEFEKILKEKLPFIEYLDLLFITSNVLNLGQFTSNRRIDLISKFYRLDRINAYWKTAIDLYYEVEGRLNEEKRQRDGQISVLNHIISRLTELDNYKDVQLDDLNSKLNELNKFRDIKSRISFLESSKWDLIGENNKCTNNIERYKVYLKDDPNELDKILDECNKAKKDIELAQEEFNNRKVKYYKCNSELKTVESEGLNLKNQIEKLSEGNCPLCGAPLSEHKNKQILDELKSKKDELGSRWMAITSELQESGLDGINTLELDNIERELKSRKSDVEKKLITNQNKKTEYSKNKSLYDYEIKRKEEIENKIKAVDNELIELKNNNDIPSDLDEQLRLLNIEFTKYNEYHTELKHKEELESIISEFDKRIETISLELEDHNKYLSLVSNGGKVFEIILTQLAKNFSTEDIKYEVESGIYRGSPYINFDAYYKPRRKFRRYDTLSDGQKTLCDINFLDKLFSVQVGLLVLDEMLAHLDDKNSPRIYDILRNMNVNTLIVASHDSNISMYTRRLLLNLNDNGETEILSE